MTADVNAEDRSPLYAMDLAELDIAAPLDNASMPEDPDEKSNPS